MSDSPFSSKCGFSPRTTSVLPIATLLAILFLLSVPVGATAYIGFLKLSSLATHLHAHTPPAGALDQGRVRIGRASVVMPDARLFSQDEGK